MKRTHVLLIILSYILISTLSIKYTKNTQSSRFVIVSEPLMNTISQITGFEKGMAKAAAPVPPFVILRRQDHEMNETRVQHELTHHLQALESLRLRQLRSQGEYRYARWVLNKDHMQAYLRKATEQEAYLNQTNPTYIHTRPVWATRKYVMHKQKFHLEEYQVVVE